MTKKKMNGQVPQHVTTQGTQRQRTPAQIPKPHSLLSAYLPQTVKLFLDLHRPLRQEIPTEPEATLYNPLLTGHSAMHMPCCSHGGATASGGTPSRPNERSQERWCCHDGSRRKGNRTDAIHTISNQNRSAHMELPLKSCLQDHSICKTTTVPVLPHWKTH